MNLSVLQRLAGNQTVVRLLTGGSKVSSGSLRSVPPYLLNTIQRVQVKAGFGPRFPVIWDTAWSDTQKEEALSVRTLEELQKIHNHKTFQIEEKGEWKSKIADRVQADADPVIGDSTTGGSAPHRKTPEGRTRALRVTYAPGDGEQTSRAHIAFFLEHAKALGFRLLIATTSKGQLDLCRNLSGLSEAQIVKWEILPKAPSKWAEDNIEYLNSGLGVETRHFPPRALEAAMTQGRAERSAWAGKNVSPGRINSPDGVPFGMLVNSPEMTSARDGGSLRKRIRAYVEGGNMISGEDANGKPIVLVGRDAIHATAKLYSTSIEHVLRLLAEDFGTAPEQVVAVEQPGKFHLDMGLLFVGKGVVVVNDSKRAAESTGKASDIASTISALEDEAARDLEKSDLKVIRKSFSGLSHNFFNGEFVAGEDGNIYYLTNGADERRQGEFREFLREFGVADVFFTPSDVARSTLGEQGGVGCRAKGIPDSSLNSLLREVRPPSMGEQSNSISTESPSHLYVGDAERAVDAVEVDGVVFTPTVLGIRDDGHCFWDTLERLQFPTAQLQYAALTAGLTYGDWVDNDKLTDFVGALNQLRPDSAMRLRVHHVDQAQDGPMKPGESVDYGTGQKIVRIGLFYMQDDKHGGHGHFVPPK